MFLYFIINVSYQIIMVIDICGLIKSTKNFSWGHFSDQGIRGLVFTSFKKNGCICMFIVFYNIITDVYCKINMVIDAYGLY